MKNILLLLPALMLIAACKCSSDKRGEEAPPVYPKTKKTDVTDNYFGTVVADPYRWLENDTTAETAEWVKEQNAVTFSYLEKIPFRNKLKERIGKLWNFERYSAPFKKGDYYFFYKNNGMQNQSVLYMQEGLAGEPKVLLDPNKLSDDGTTALAAIGISPDAKYLGYAVSKGGSDWNEIYVLNILTGETLKDHLKWAKFTGISWQKEGFYYSRYDAPEGAEYSAKNEYHKLYYHRLGDDQSMDELVLEDSENPKINYYADVNEDQTMLVVYESNSTYGNAIHFRDLTKYATGFKTVVPDWNHSNSVIDFVDGKLIMMTDNAAPNKKVVLVDPAKPDESNWQTLIAEKDFVLENISLAGGNIVASYLKDAASKVIIYSMTGQELKEIALPAMGSVNGFSGKRKDKTGFYTFSSFLYPATIYKYDFETGESSVFKKPDIDFDASQYETKQVFFTSKDGTKVPMFLTHKKGLELDGNNPTLLYGYGGFNISKNPEFRADRLVLLENGGVFALANIRGGSEYGETWHEAGTKLKKQNVFDDFIAASEYLIKENYTSSEKLAIEGRSNGGLLIGVCITQRPELFKVALPTVGVMDMLRFHKFTIGWAWTSDYGSSEDSLEFQALYKYSPLHNIKEMEYPATLVLTADHDDRVVPAHSFKFISTLQEKQKGKNPTLIRIDVMAGHGAGKPISKLVEEQADIWSFTFKNLGIEPYPQLQ